MANVSAHKTIGQTFSETPVWYKLTYDFANDGGTATTYDLATFAAKTLILEAHAHVETACTSGGMATVEIGVNDADANLIMDTTSGAVANLVDDFVHNEDASHIGIVAASADTLRLTIGTAALTAGKINVWVKCVTVA